MKRLSAVLVLSVALLAGPASAVEVLLGTITATTTKNNSDTAVPFTIGGSNRVLVQCDAAAYLVLGSATTTAATSSTGVKVDADEKWETRTGDSYVYLAVLPVSGTANCKVWRVQ